jgi:hypothetical protein
MLSLCRRPGECVSCSTPSRTCGFDRASAEAKWMSHPPLK